MDQQGFTNCLKAVLYGGLEVHESFAPDGIARVETFEDAGVPTTDRGLGGHHGRRNPVPGHGRPPAVGPGPCTAT